VTVLYLVRHGLTDVTGKRLTGREPGHHLSAAGREQADRLVERFRGVPLDAVVSSPLERCRETAAPLARDRRLSVRVRKDLTEVDYGEWTGRPLKQLVRTKLWRVVQTLPSAVRFPGGERLLDVQARAVRALEALAEEHPKHRIAVFSHADVIKLALAHFQAMPVDAYQRLVIDTTSVSALVVGEGPPRVMKVNDTGGLQAFVPGPPTASGDGKVRG